MSFVHRVSFALLALLTPAGAGCFAVPARNPVQIASTDTPGLAWVIVAPRGDGPMPAFRDGKRPVLGESEYVLLCDARGREGVLCRRPPEVSGEQATIGIGTTLPAPPVIGTLGGAAAGVVAAPNAAASASAAAEGGAP